MKFEILAECFEKLEGISSRLELIRILSELFGSIHKGEEIERLCYLVQGRVAPFFEPVEFGMAERTVAAAIALSCGVEREEVLMLYGKLGDMGLVAQQQRSKIKDQRSEIRVDVVFEKLLEITKVSGAGTVEKKMGLFSELLGEMDGVGAKYLARVVLGKLRLGVGDPTILDALVTAKFGDKSKRKVLEGAYNRTSDLGYIARTLWEDGLEGVEKLSVTVGRPIRSELCERLPNPEKVIEKMGEVDAQFKFDGFRVQIHKKGEEVRIFSRNLEEMTHMFPELIEGTLKQVRAKSVILDGEAIAYQTESEEFLPFQETTKRRRKYKIEETAKALPLKAFIFDILYKDGKSLIEEPLVSRLEILKETLDGNDILIPAKTQKVSEAGALQVILDESFSKGLEGVVIKKLESPYEAGGRNFNWVKLKRHSAGDLSDTIDCVVLGYIYGKGKRTAFGAGALLVGVYDKDEDAFVTVSKIGTGLTDEEWRSIKEKTAGMEMDHRPARVNSLITPSVWVRPEIVIEVLADEITRSPLHTAGRGMNHESRITNHGQGDGEMADAKLSGDQVGYALRFPRLVSFRDKDKKVEDATTVAELVEMYGEQGKK